MQYESAPYPLLGGAPYRGHIAAPAISGKMRASLCGSHGNKPGYDGILPKCIFTLWDQITIIP